MYYGYDEDFLNTWECIRRNKYSEKAQNVFLYAPDCIKIDMFSDFESNPKLSEEEFMKRYKKIVYKNWPFKNNY